MNQELFSLFVYRLVGLLTATNKQGCSLLMKTFPLKKRSPLSRHSRHTATRVVAAHHRHLISCAAAKHHSRHSHCCDTRFRHQHIVTSEREDERGRREDEGEERGRGEMRKKRGERREGEGRRQRRVVLMHVQIPCASFPLCYCIDNTKYLIYHAQF